MIYYQLSKLNSPQQVSIGSFSNRTKVFKIVQHILKQFQSVEFVGIYDFQKQKKKVNHKNLSNALTLLNVDEAFSLKFTSNENIDFHVEVSKLKMNPEIDSIYLPLSKLT
jgi:hypothetical protein